MIAVPFEGGIDFVNPYTRSWLAWTTRENGRLVLQTTDRIKSDGEREYFARTRLSEAAGEPVDPGDWRTARKREH